MISVSNEAVFRPSSLFAILSLSVILYGQAKFPAVH